MSSEESGPAEPVQQNGTVALIKALRKTFLLLMFAVACFGVLAAVYFDVVELPARGLAIAVMVSCISGPFIVTYSVLVAWYARRSSRIPVAKVDRDQREFHLKYFSPSEFADMEIIGELADRRTNAGKMYIVEELEIEQRERVNPETGEKETYPQRVARASWEGFIDPFEFMESVAAFRKAKEELVPLAQEALEAKAGQDIDTLKNSDRFSVGLLKGAEKDTFFDDAGGAAFDWDLDGGPDLEELEKRSRPDDDDDDRDDLPEPGSREMQSNGDLSAAADVTGDADD